MELLMKVIRWASIIFISLMLLVTLLVIVLPVEIKDSRLFDEFERVRFFGLPSGTLLLLVSTINANDTPGVIVVKLVRAVLITAGVMYVMFITVFAGMCQWTDRKTVFIHKHDERKRVVVRDLGCGAWDSGPPVRKTVMVRDLGPWFNVVTAVDTTSMDRSDWVRP